MTWDDEEYFLCTVYSGEGGGLVVDCDGETYDFDPDDGGWRRPAAAAKGGADAKSGRAGRKRPREEDEDDWGEQDTSDEPEEEEDEDDEEIGDGSD